MAPSECKFVQWFFTQCNGEINIAQLLQDKLHSQTFICSLFGENQFWGMFVSKPDESRTIPQIYFLQYIYFLSADNSSKWPNERTQKSIQFLFPASFIIDVLRLQLGKLFIVLDQGSPTDNTGKDNGNQYNLILLRSNHEKIDISFLMMYRFEIFHIFRFLLDPKEPIQA